ncbi:MAG: hypothetical protein P1U85_09125 [Verrucomicrobiales bacterium]|nr:hypothetical protein [Verrucomicrobiales bacterium]
MRALTNREKALLGICFGVIFLIANAFAYRSISGKLRGSNDRIMELDNQLKDQEMWLEEAQMAAAREQWLNATMPAAENFGKEQADLLQSVQDELFDRKIRIEQQSLQEITKDPFYTEVAIRLTIRGEQMAVIDWLTTLQNRDQFQVIKALSFKIDTKSKEPEPQAICQITLAKWFAPAGPPEAMTNSSNSQESGVRG